MLRWLLIGLTGLSLAACSGMRMGYNNADSLLAYRMNDWFALSNELDDPAKERIARVKAWHRREELPEYARMLDTFNTRLEDPSPVTPQEVLTLHRQVMRRMLRTGGQVADEFADIIGRLGPAQRKRLAQRIDESNREYREKSVDAAPAKLRTRRIDETVERYEFWLGKLNRSQVERVTRWVESIPADNGQFRLAQRQRRQQAFMSLVGAAASATPSDTAARLRAFFAELETPADAASRERQRVMLEGWAAMTADLINSATPAQRNRARERLRAMSDDFSELSKGK